MRDEEFLRVLSKLEPKLDKYFHKKMKENGFTGDWAVLKEDLIQLTVLKAFENSRNSDLDHYSIDTLIWLKAKNVWYDYIHPSRRQHKKCTQNEAEELQSGAIDIYHTFATEENMSLIDAIPDANSKEALQLFIIGYNYVEIANKLHISVGSLKMKIYRLRKRLNKKRE